MKKNDWILLSSVAAYSYLFFRQSAGINFLLFSILLILLLVFRNSSILKNKTWVIVAAGTLASSFCVFYFANGLSVIANIISLMLLSALSFSPDTSVITSLLFSFYSIIASFVFMVLDSVERAQKKKENSAQQSGFIKLMLYGIPVFIVILFFFLYKGSNPIFNDLTKNITLDFISAEWIIFTLLGSFLLYGFFYHKIIDGVALRDKSIPNALSPGLINHNSWLARNLNIENEVLSGIILFSLLNGLLLIVNALDMNYLWCDGTLPQGLSYSSFVHQGTGLLIISIIIAILIIMFYFRGSVNFYEKNKVLKLLAYVWILQNAFMIISTAFRNQLYINEYSLTYKRIGVYVWLLLALIGLVTTFIKIMRYRSNWYLFRINAWLFYSILVLGCFVNWDLIVTDFNINRSLTTNRPLDKFYLLSLSDKSLPQLLVLNDSIKNQQNPAEDWGSLGSSSGESRYETVDFKTELDVHLYNFLSRMRIQEWKSWNVSDARVLAEIVKLNEEEKIKGLKLNGYRDLELASLNKLSNIRSLDLSGTFFYSWEELDHFEKLESLTLSKNKIRDLVKFPHFNHLRKLDLSNNNIRNIHPLSVLRNLESLDISGNAEINSFSALLSMKKLNYLKIGLITCEGFETLQHTLPNVTIEATILN